MFGKRFISSLIVMTALGSILQGQSVTTLQRQAEKSLSQGKPAEAAALYERAGRLNNSDPNLLFQAAEAYNRVRDYLNASNGYRAAKDDPRFPLAALRYARTLKQQGRFEEAQEAFQKARASYAGDHKAVILQVVDNEIDGCTLALQLQAQADTLKNAPVLRWLPPPMRTDENAFAPLPFSDTLLYFTQAREKQSVLLRSTKKDSLWRKPVEAFGLPEAAAQGFLCGTFTPDGQRFYFARSETPPLAALGNSLQSKGGTLYVLRHLPSGDWGEPEQLRPYINLEGSAALWPFVCHYGGEEWLFFASDRPGGMGGLDLYWCKRPLSADDVDFSFPLNLGNKVNTGADETTPFYDVFTKTLWFSSLGHPSLGGLDVHFSTGEANQWAKPENAGMPINSPADDYFFALKRDGSGAFLASNRAVAQEKPYTTDDDLFEVVFPRQD